MQSQSGVTMPDINQIVANKVYETINVEAVAADIAKHIDGKKLGAAIEKALLAEIKEFYWSDIIDDIANSDAVRARLEEAMLEGLKNKK